MQIIRFPHKSSPLSVRISCFPFKSSAIFAQAMRLVNGLLFLYRSSIVQYRSSADFMQIIHSLYELLAIFAPIVRVWYILFFPCGWYSFRTNNFLYPYGTSALRIDHLISQIVSSLAQIIRFPHESFRFHVQIFHFPYRSFASFTIYFLFPYRSSLFRTSLPFSVQIVSYFRTGHQLLCSGRFL